MIWAYLVLFAVLIVLSIVREALFRKECKTMTVQKFLSRCEEYAKKHDQTGLSRFMVKHIAFCVAHREEIEQRIQELSAEYNKKE